MNVSEQTNTKRRLNTVEIVLLALGSPIWLSLGISALAVIVSLYLSLWTGIISLWAGFASAVACSLAGGIACIVFIVSGNAASGLAMLAAGMVCAGLSILMFYGCKVATKGILVLTKKMAIGRKKCFIKKEEA